MHNVVGRRAGPQSGLPEWAQNGLTWQPRTQRAPWATPLMTVRQIKASGQNAVRSEACWYGAIQSDTCMVLPHCPVVQRIVLPCTATVQFGHVSWSLAVRSTVLSDCRVIGTNVILPRGNVVQCTMAHYMTVVHSGHVAWSLVVQQHK